MAQVSVFNMQGAEVGKIELSDAVFGAEINENLVHEAVVAHLAAARQGTQKAKTRSEVSGGGRKPWRQKGTGHARQGSTRSPQWKGGGVVFAPVPRDYTISMNKKERRAALRSALSGAVADGKLLILDELRLDEVKTKEFAKVLSALHVEKALVVLDSMDQNVILSARNIPAVATCQAAQLSTYDIMKYGTVVTTEKAARIIEEVYA